MVQATPTVPATPGEGDDPSKLHGDIERLRADHALNRALMGGTDAMVAAGELYLPKMRRENADTYKRRLKLAELRNFYRQAIASLNGKLMRNGLRLDETAGGNVPKDDIALWLKDLDRCGTAADVLFKRSFTWAIRDAATWLLAEMPVTLRPDGSKITLADERQQAIRPYLIPLSIYDVLGWRTERTNGREVLSQFRYLMVSEEPVGLYGTKMVETIRVIEPNRIFDLRKGANGSWERFGVELPNTLQRVPVTRYASDADEDQRPRGGLNDLAGMNKEHWQLRSDQRLALRIQSFGILFGTGMKSLPPIGPESAVIAEEPGATLSFVESSGAALTAGRQELVDLEDAMRAQSAQYQARTVQQTATGSAIDAQEASSPAQGWAVNAKRGFESALADMCELAGKKAEPILRVDTDALVSTLDQTAIATLASARAQGEISHEAFISSLKRADLLPDDFDIAADKALLDAEPPPELPGINTPPGVVPGVVPPKGAAK